MKNDFTMMTDCYGNLTVYSNSPCKVGYIKQSSQNWDDRQNQSQKDIHMHKSVKIIIIIIIIITIIIK